MMEAFVMEDDMFAVSDNDEEAALSDPLAESSLRLGSPEGDGNLKRKASGSASASSTKKTRSNGLIKILSCWNGTMLACADKYR